MNVDRAFQQSVRLPCEHERAEDLHEFAAFGSEDGSAQDAVVRSIYDDLHEAGGFAALDRARLGGHLAFNEFLVVTSGAGFSLGYGVAAELRILGNAGRYEVLFYREILSFSQLSVIIL